MPTLKDILPIEDNRQDPQTWNKIHLFKQGDFWHAYDWSAWLICRVIFADDVRKYGLSYTPLKVKRLERTDIEGTYCNVGFPLKSLEKYVPVRDNFESDGDSHLIVSIKLPNPSVGKEVDYEMMNAAFHKWMETFEVKEKKGKKKLSDAIVPEPTPVASSGGMLAMILQYPLGERNGMENIRFIQQLKNTVASIL